MGRAGKEPAKRNDAVRWSAIVNRDATHDGMFTYSVATTGIYCRPSCPARRPNRANVCFHETAKDAERAGFRPCKRCHPNGASRAERSASLVTRACRLIETSDDHLSLSSLAAQAGLSAAHFHRLFKSVTGVTPKAYANAKRRGAVRKALNSSRTVTEAVLDGAFQSSGRFYATANHALGMTPTAFKAGGTDVKIHFAVGRCWLGDILVAQSVKGVCAISLGDDAGLLVRELQDRFPNAQFVGADKTYERVVAQVVGLIKTPGTAIALPLDIRGTAFQLRVWDALRQIPPGQTASYADIARAIGKPDAVRAVAGACAANTLAVAIPCHRVVRSDGSLSGYRWGVARKRSLLDREIEFTSSAQAKARSGRAGLRSPRPR